MTKRTPQKIRNLATFEHLFAAYGETGAMVFSVAARIGSVVPKADLVKALSTVQARHPLLRASIDWDEDGVHAFAGSENPIPLTVMSGQEIQWHHVAQDEVNRPFRAADGPLIRLVALSGAAETTVVLTFHHSVADGLAALFVMHEMLVALSGGRFHDAPSADVLDERLGMQLPRFPRNARRDDAGPLAASSDLSQDARPKAAVKVIDLQEAFTEKLVHAAKSHGATVNSMLTAALGRAQMSLDSRWKRETLRVMSPIDFKPVLSIPDQVGVFLSIAITPFEQGEREFWAEANRVRQQIDKFRSTEMASRIVGDLAKRFADDVSYDASRERIVRQIPYDTVMTNLGLVRLPARYGDLAVERVWAPVLRSVPGQDVIAAATFGGVLSLVQTSVGGTEGLLDRMVEVLDDL
jgi:hypothetical protein